MFSYKITFAMINVLKFFRIYFSLLIAAIQVWGILFIVIIILAFVLSMVEQMSLGDALYLSFITILTVGYGDIVPHSFAGKIISIMLGFIGMIFMGIFVAAAIKSLEKASID